MLREKERYDHENFINQVERHHQNAVNNHLSTVTKHLNYREFKNAVGYVPVDQRQLVK